MDRHSNTIPLIRARAEAQSTAGFDACFTGLAASANRILEVRSDQGPGDKDLLDYLIAHAAMTARLIEQFSVEARAEMADKDFYCRTKILHESGHHCGICGK
jgi:hypothetical protein